jgi:hypothetical protein
MRLQIIPEGQNCIKYKQRTLPTVFTSVQDCL